MKEDEILPAISPLGYIPKRRRMIGQIIRLSLSAKKRRSWNDLFFLENWDTSLSEERTGKLSSCFEMVRLGPSAKNKQPWRLIMDLENNMVHFFIQRENPMDPNTPVRNFQKLDIGIAMCHFELTANSMGIFGEWIEKDPEISKDFSYPTYVMSWKYKT